MTASLLLSLALPALAIDRPAPLPEPLEATPFAVRDPQLGTLSNGLDVVIFPNHEVPIWQARLVIGLGEYVDPPGKEGLTALTMDLMDGGAGERSGTEIARALHLLAAEVDTRLEDETAFVTVSGITRNLAPSLDIWADIIERPTFPADELEIVRARQVGDLRVALQTPRQIATLAAERLIYGDDYIGRHATEDSLSSVSLADIQGLYARYIGPENAVLLVGGDVDAAELLPLLEERIGSWAPPGIEPAPVRAEPIPVKQETLYFIDKPGAAQSVIQSFTATDPRGAPSWFALEVGNRMFGEAFTGRVNMNLREDKGYTYGARCRLSARHGAGHYRCATSVRTDATAASLVELRGELAAVRGDRPLTDAEVDTAKQALAQKWPQSFETTDRILNQEFEIWRYGLSEDWAAEYIPRVRDVDIETANAAFMEWIVPESTFWLIVGDRDEVFKDLQDLGLPIVELERAGTPKIGK